MRRAAGPARPLQEPPGRAWLAQGAFGACRLRRAGADPQADRVCVLGGPRELGPYLRRVGDRTPEKLIEMPNGVDTDLFVPGGDDSGLRERLQIPAGAPVAAFVALDRAHHFKRLDIAIDAVARLAGEGDEEVHLVVAGGGALLEPVPAVPQSGIRTESISSAPCRLQSCLGAPGGGHVRAHHRAPESFGIVLIEAMATRLPVIATDYPGVLAVVDEGRSGHVVASENPDAVAGAIRRLLAAGTEGRSRMGNAGREKPSGSGAGVLARSHGRGICPGDRSASRKAGSCRVTARRILFVAYFYPPCRDTGAQRPAAMVRWLRRLGHEVTVLTTSAYGTLPDDADQRIVRSSDVQRWRARLRGKNRVDALYDGDTYAGRPHPLSKVLVPEPLVAAWARLLAGAR